MITFDPTNKRIILDSAYVSAAQIYSRWKEWALVDGNSKYEKAFEAQGGEPLGGDLFTASYFFLMNGWRIRPMEADHTLVITGTITPAGGGVPVVRTLGNYNVSVQLTVPVQAQGIATSGSSLTIEGIVAGLMSALQNQTFDVNVKEIADKPLKTWNGTEWV